MPPTRTQLRANVLLAEALERRAVPTLRRIAELIAEHDDTHDGWPPRGDTAGRGGGPAIIVPDEHGNPDRIPVTGVEAAAFARTAVMPRLDADRQALERIVTSMAELAHRALGICDTYAVVVEPAKCSGGNGYDWWPATRDGDRCHNVATKGGLCDACYMARRRFDQRMSAA